MWQAGGCSPLVDFLAVKESVSLGWSGGHGLPWGLQVASGCCVAPKTAGLRVSAWRSLQRWVTGGQTSARPLSPWRSSDP